jgi:hypothetical protein
MWSELDQILLRSRLIDLSRILVTQGSASTDVARLYEVDVPRMFQELAFGGTHSALWSVGAASKEIELLCVTLERELALATVLDSTTRYLTRLRPFFPGLASGAAKAPKGNASLRRSFGRSASQSSSAEPAPQNAGVRDLEQQDMALRRAFDYAIASVNSYHPETFLASGFEAIVDFVEQAFGPALKHDVSVLNSAIVLATLFVRQKSDPGSFVTFFQNHMVESFSTVIAWQNVSTPKLQKLCIEILNFGYHCVQAGNTNRYKFFCWFMPPIYNLVSSLKSTDDNKADIVSEIVSACLTTLQKGNDIDLLLRDGVPMVLNLFQLQPTQIAPTLRMVATKLLQHNNFWSLLQMNFCLNSAREHFTGFFASSEAIDNFFRYLISKGQRKMINAANEVIVAHLKRPQYFGIRNYIFASFEPDLEAFQNQPLPKSTSSEESEGVSAQKTSEVQEESTESASMISAATASVPAHSSSNSTSNPSGDNERGDELEEGEEKEVELPLPKYRVDPKTLLSMDAISDLLGLLASVFAMDRNDKGVMKIVMRLLADVRAALESHRLNSEAIDAFRDHLSRVLLFKNLFPQLLAQQAESESPEALAKLFMDTFPPDVIRDEETMSVLSSLGTRIERVTNQLQKFQHVSSAMTSLLNTFLSWKPSPEMDNLAQQIYFRRRHLRDLVFHMPANEALRAHLISVGYHPDFFQKDLEIRVDVDDRRNLDELFKTNLSTLYNEYLDILKELYPNIKHIHYEGADVPLEDYFVENHRTSFTVEDIRARRNFAIKMIDKRLKDHPNRANLQNRKLSLLTREEALEETLEKDKLAEGLAPPQRRRYWVRLNNSFWKVAACCGKQISGCYAPNGDHAEKVLENSMKANVGFMSLYEAKPSRKTSSEASGKKSKKKKGKKGANASEKTNQQNDDADEDGPGLEIENIEVLYTDQGIYTFKLYTNGHNLDTTLAWLQFFKILATSRLVPAVIIPNNFPNVRIFAQLENFVPTQVAGSIISFRDNYFDEFGVTSYYDIPVEKIKLGDIVLDEENAAEIMIADNVDLHQDGLKSSGSRSRLIQSTNIDAHVVTDKEHENMKSRQMRHKPQQDFNGMTLSSSLRNVKQRVSDDAELQPYLYTIEAFVRYISQYLSLYMERGIRDKTLVSVGLDLESWNRRKQVKNQAQLTETTKINLFDTIVNTIHEDLDQWLDPQRLCSLFIESRSQFFELRSHWIQLADLPLSLGNSDSHGDLEATLTPEQLRYLHSDAANAKRGLNLCFSLMSELRTTISFDKVPRISQEQLIKWIFGNEDRVWRDRGGRPGEETLSVFLNFCRVYEEDPKQLTQAQQQVRLSTQAQQELAARTAAAAEAARNSVPVAEPSAAPEAPLEPSGAIGSIRVPVEAQELLPEGEAEAEALSSFKGHHHGNTPWGGFVTLGSVPKEDTVEALEAMAATIAKGATGTANKEIVAYCIGDYIAPDDFEVITAWVHPNYRSFGLALELYKRTAYRLSKTGARFVTFDMLLGTVEHLFSTSPALKLLHSLGILQRIITKRRNSHSSDTEHGTERFERLTVSLRLMVLAFKIMDLWSQVKRYFQRWMNPQRFVEYPWKTWLRASLSEEAQQNM